MMCGVRRPHLAVLRRPRHNRPLKWNAGEPLPFPFQGRFDWVSLSWSGEPAPALAVVAHDNARWRPDLALGSKSGGMLPINPASLPSAQTVRLRLGNLPLPYIV